MPDELNNSIRAQAGYYVVIVPIDVALDCDLDWIQMEYPE